MKTRTILLSIVLIFAIPAISSAQIGNVLKNKVGKAVNAGVKVLNKEADKKIDSTATVEAQKAYDKAEQERAAQEAAQAEEAEQGEQAGDTEQQSDKRPSGGINLGGLMGGGKVTSKYSESYSFNNRIYTEMEMYDGKDVAKMNYFIYFNDENANAGFESKMVTTSDEGGQVEVNTSFIVDGDNKSFMMMTDMGGMRIGVISEVPDENTAEGQATSEDTDATFTKTGNTRMIAGYKCDEYKYVDNDTKEYGFIWATKDLKLQADKRTFSKAGMSPYYGSKDLDNSVVLAMEGYSKKGELEMKSETKEVNLGYKHDISTTGFSFRQMNFSQAGQKEKK
ncbi:MAG: hypothetical protein A2V64_05070 [Bacteroidetes bacterium RBG_13_43_22]|nr:MAG: hypothetical protein A2V64_05070 [Bacteroidetes bacterium RBG_13_43_22]